MGRYAASRDVGSGQFWTAPAQTPAPDEMHWFGQLRLSLGTLRVIDPVRISPSFKRFDVKKFASYLTNKIKTRKMS